MSSIKNEDPYEVSADTDPAVRFISDTTQQTQAVRPPVDGTNYETWSKTALYQQVKIAKVKGRSKMDKSEMIQSLRNL